MNKSIIAVAWLSAVALSAPIHAQNSSKQHDGAESQSAPNPSGDQSSTAGASGQNRTGAAGNNAPVTDNVRKSSPGSASGTRSTESEGPRATGAGPSVPREGNGAATSGSNTNSTSGQSSGSPKPGDTAR
jgi:hypothetical protein